MRSIPPWESFGVLGVDLWDHTWLTWELLRRGPLEAKIFWHHSLTLRAGLFPVPSVTTCPELG